MRLNKKGELLIKTFEAARGPELKSYPDPATGGKPFTAGYGSTCRPNGEPIKPGEEFTVEECEEFFKHDVEKFESHLDECLDVELTENQWAACVSLMYNIGPGNFRKSTLLTLLNEGLFEMVGEQFLRWNKAAGKVMAGLTRRRQAEADLFNTPDEAREEAA
jgi:lysozyme